MLATRIGMIGLLVGTTQTAFAATPELHAKDLARAASVSGGFFVYVGAADETMAVEMAAMRRFVVQILASNDSEADALRTRIRDRKMASHIAVDHVAFGTLPYVDNLVNLLLIENGPAARLY